MDERARVKRVMPILLIMYVLVCQNSSAFSIISPVLTEHFHISASVAALQITISTVVFAISGTIYGTVTDFVPIKKVMLFCIMAYVGGSVLGLILKFNFYLFIIARLIQEIGSSAVSGLYIVIVARYLDERSKIRYFALLTACFQFAQAVGVLTGGLIATYVQWWMLFIIPFIIVLFVPFLMKNLPDESFKERQHIDIAGLLLLALFVSAISIYFVNMELIWIGISLLFLLVFMRYIRVNKNAFITIDFFKNRNYLIALAAEFLIYGVQIPFPFLYSFIISELYNMSLDKVSYVMLPAYVAAAVFGSAFTNKIVGRVGKYRTLQLAMAFIVLALISTGCLMENGVAGLSLTSVLFSLGYVLMYSPMVDTVVGTLPKEQIGRGIGFNSLILNICASIGEAIVAQLMMSKVLMSCSLPFIQNPEARRYTSIMILMALAAFIGAVLFCWNRKNFNFNDTE